MKHEHDNRHAIVSPNTFPNKSNQTRSTNSTIIQSGDLPANQRFDSFFNKIVNSVVVLKGLFCHNNKNWQRFELSRVQDFPGQARVTWRD